MLMELAERKLDELLQVFHFFVDAQGTSSIPSCRLRRHLVDRMWHCTVVGNPRPSLTLRWVKAGHLLLRRICWALLLGIPELCVLT